MDLLNYAVWWVVIELWERKGYDSIALIETPAHELFEMMDDRVKRFYNTLNRDYDRELSKHYQEYRKDSTEYKAIMTGREAAKK